MTFNKLQDIIYEFVSQNKILKTLVDFSDYIVYAFVTLYFISKLVAFSSLLDAILYNLFFALFILAAIGKKYIALIALLINSILCSLNELFLTFISSLYISNFSYSNSIHVWKIIISIFLNFLIFLLVLFVFMKYNDTN